MAASRLHAAWVLIILAAACGGRKPVPVLGDLVQEFVHTSLSYSPVNATAAGYHAHNGMPLDILLDSYDENELGRQRTWYRDFQARLQLIDAAKLTPEDQADYMILRDQAALALLELDTIQSYKHNPTLYVELVGNALFSPFMLEYAPLEERYRHIVERLRRVPQLLGQARQNLVNSPTIWTEVALSENQGNRDLIVDALGPRCPPRIKRSFDHASLEAIHAIEDFGKFLQSDLANRSGDWRLGAANYAAKFAPALGLGQTPQQVLSDAEAELAATRQQMTEIVRKSYPGLSIRDALAQIALRHASPQTYFADARRDLEEVRQFVRKKSIVPLPQRDNLQVIETPVFMRGIYAVGGFNPAPALEPKLGAFYWITPIPANWPPDRVQSKLREYNFYGLKLLTIHEAIPGHYLQSEFANDVQPQTRRILRALFYNGPYVEGWAVYATDLMVEQGYLNSDPALRLTWLKQYLRAVANAILDVRLHTMNMTDDQAMDLMVNQTFQETEEATAKLQRAKLSSTQLPTYFTGYRAWKRLRQSAELRPGFNLEKFHRAALVPGAVPIPALDRILSVQ